MIAGPSGRSGIAKGATSPTSHVSVIVPVHNRRGEVIRAIRSVLDPEVDVEVIVVDDGSTIDIAESVSAVGDDRIRLMRQENAGSSAARVTGARAATGDWLLFLDSDDYLLPGALETLLALAKDRPDAGFVFGECWFEDSRKGGRAPAVTLPQGSGQDLARFVAVNSQCYNCRFLVRRSAYDAVGGYDSAIRIGAPELMVFIPLFVRFAFARTSQRIAVVCHGAEGRLSRRSAAVLEGWERVMGKLLGYQDIRCVVEPVLREARAAQWGAHGKRLYSQNFFREARDAYIRALGYRPSVVFDMVDNPVAYIVKSEIRQLLGWRNEATS